VVSLSDSASSVDSIAVAANFAVSYADGASAAAQDFDVTQNFNAQYSESASGVEAITASFAYNTAVYETASGSEPITAALQLPATITEAASAADTLTSLPDYAVAIIEGIIASDSPTTSSSVRAAIIEALTATDVNTRRLLWEDIDDDQVPGWTDIIRPQIINVVMAFGDGFFGDVSMAGSDSQAWIPDTARWTEINDDQNPGWTDIVQ
jgi:hypothetical protein